MIRRFLSDIRGNYFVLTAAAMVPIMGALALAVDYSELTRQRAATMNALDAANIATAARLIGGATEEQAKAYAKDFFEANLGPVKASNTTLIVTLPSNNAGGGTLKLEAELKYHPYFLPAAAMLIGKTSGATEVDFSAKSEVRLKNTLEVALVLDNSGSMNEEGSGTDDKRNPRVKVLATVPGCGMHEAGAGIVGDMVAGKHGDVEFVAAAETFERMGKRQDCQALRRNAAKPT